MAGSEERRGELERLRTGQVWHDFCDRLRDTGDRILAAAPDDACSKLAFRQRAPSTYPALDAIPASELAGWAELRWDASSALPGVKLRGVE